MDLDKRAIVRARLKAALAAGLLDIPWLARRLHHHVNPLELKRFVDEHYPLSFWQLERIEQALTELPTASPGPG